MSILLDEMGLDKMGLDEMGINRSGTVKRATESWTGPGYEAKTYV